MDQQNDSPGNASPPVIVVIDPDVTFSKREYGGQTSYVVHHPRLGKYFRFGVEEYHVTTLLTGSLSTAEVHAQIVADGLDWSHPDLARFIGQLVQMKLAMAAAAPQPAAVPDAPITEPAPTAPPNTSPTPKQSSPPPKQSSQPAEPPAAPRQPSGDLWTRRLPATLSLMVSQRIPLADGNAAAAKCARWLEPIFTRRGFWIWCLLVTSGLGVVYGNLTEFSGELRRIFDAGLWPLLIVIWCLTKVLHELGHAVCARRHGVRAGKMGIMFFLLAPLAYVDVTDAWKIKRRFQRVQIALAGVYVELALAAVAAWLWWWLPVGFAKHLMAQIFVVAGPATLLVNANPLLRLDGYYVLSDVLEIPNLRMHGRRQLGQRIESAMFGIPIKRSLLTGWRRPVATFHAACSVIFQFFWMGGLILAVSLWLTGLGIILAVAAFLLWGLLPLARWLHRIWTIDPAGVLGFNRKRVAVLGYVMLLTLMIQHFATTTSPLARRVPVVVRYQDEQIARASTDAFVRAVYAMRGQRVEAGMLLMELQQPELEVRRGQMADDLQLAQQRSVQFRRQGRIAQATAEDQNAASLQRQLSELDLQLQGLRVIAQRDGLITTTNTDRLLGAFVHQGEELIRVSDPNEKELLVTVGQSNAEAFQQAVGTSANVRLRGGTKLSATPTPLRPRARRSLPHPALAASVGGPLAVEPSPDDEAESRLVQPYLESVAPLDPIASAQVRAGQLGTMTISDDRSLVTRMVDALWPTRR